MELELELGLKVELELELELGACWRQRPGQAHVPTEVAASMAVTFALGSVSSSGSAGRQEV